jgi:hypothetical protein
MALRTGTVQAATQNELSHHIESQKVISDVLGIVKVYAVLMSCDKTIPWVHFSVRNCTHLPN